MIKIRKFITWLLATVLAVAVLALLYAFIFYPAEYTLRLLRWGDADVYDYQKFPERMIPASSEPFRFDVDLAETAVSTQFSSNPIIDGDFEQFLIDTGTQAFLVIQNDTILYETYFNGASRDSIVTSFSMAKSYASTLVGIAIAEGHIQSVDDPITDYLPELVNRDPAFANITIRDLLLMSSGIHYAEFPFVNGDDAKTYYYPDLRDLALNQTEIDGTPGETFLYNNYHPLLLGMILERATGMPVADYLAQKIWQPIGAEFDGSWSLDERSFEKMESGINGRAVDFAKFGRLILHQGNWNGDQIVPATWIKDATNPDPSRTGHYYSDGFYEAFPNGYYKYMWWGLTRDDAANDFAALGNHGQFIYLSPHKNLIIVRHGEKYGIPASAWMQLFYEYASGIDTVTGG